jgi:uncharacterized protein
MGAIDITLEQALAQRVRQQISVADAAHAFDHVQEVARLAKWLLTTVPAEPRIVVAAAYCHDLCSRSEVGFTEAIPRSVQAARLLLSDLGYGAEEIDQVGQCIVTASWEYALQGGQPHSPEASVLRDADWLEAIGAHGIARVFAFAGHYQVPLTFVDLDPERPPRLRTRGDQPDPSAFHHFYAKLLWVKDGLLTEPGRHEGERRHRVLVTFLREYRAEYERTGEPH